MKKLMALCLLAILTLSFAACETDTKWVKKQAVMIDGQLYFATGEKSYFLKTDVTADGKITSTVELTETPTLNDQSNFGVGFDYRYSETEDTIEIFINNEWWVYAVEKIKNHALLSADKKAEFLQGFSYAEDAKKYKVGDRGVNLYEFINTDVCPISDSKSAVRRAKNELTVSYNKTEVYCDPSADIWKVVFSVEGVAGGCQTVYTDSNGITLLVVYGE